MFKKTSTLTIFMRSGNKIIVDKVLDWEFGYQGNDITSAAITQRTSGLFKAKNKLFIGTIDLSQIECVVESKYK